jgi:hypothetical protein
MTQGGGPGSGEFHGEGRDLHTAIEDAWGKRSQNDPKTLRVAEISVTGDNPISGYRVVLRP